MPSSPSSDDLEHVEVVVIELVVGQAGAQRGGALLGELVVDVGEAFGELVVDDVVVVVALVGHGVSSSRRARRHDAGPALFNQ